MSLAGEKFTGRDFTERNLSGINLAGSEFMQCNFSAANLAGARCSGSKFLECNFDLANLTQADCSDSKFVACTFRKTNCYRTNFKDSILQSSVFEPADCYGMTVSLTCRTFMNMQVSQQWWYGWLYMATLMVPATHPVSNVRESLIAAIGAARYVQLKRLFLNRTF